MATAQPQMSGADRSASTSAATLRYARERAGLSVRSAAGRVGVSASTLSAYEKADLIRYLGEEDERLGALAALAR